MELRIIERTHRLGTKSYIVQKKEYYFCGLVDQWIDASIVIDGVYTDTFDYYQCAEKLVEYIKEGLNIDKVVYSTTL